MLAIVIPYYKKEFFKETLDSLAAQTNKNFKVYIGNDAAPHDPAPLLKKYHNLDIAYQKFETNLGKISLSKQWERCIDMLNDEDWIMILGDDDVLDPKVVATFYRHFTKFKEITNIIRFASVVIDGSSQVISNKYEHPPIEAVSQSFFKKQNKVSRSSLSEYIFSKASYARYQFHAYALGWFSDDRAWFEFSEGKPIYTINEASVFIRLSEISISGRADNYDLKIKAKKNFYRYLIDKQLTNFKREQRASILINFEQSVLETGTLNLRKKIYLLRHYIALRDPIALKKFIRGAFLGKKGIS